MTIKAKAKAITAEGRLFDRLRAERDAAIEDSMRLSGRLDVVEAERDKAVAAAGKYAAAMVAAYAHPWRFLWARLIRRGNG